MVKKREFFNSIKNAENLSNLVLSRLINLKVSTLSEYLEYELPSITFLNLQGYSKSFPQSLLGNLKGIEKFTGLKTLKVNYTSANLDISAIKNCPTLTDVTSTYANIKNLSGIEELTNLQNLTLNAKIKKELSWV